VTRGPSLLLALACALAAAGCGHEVGRVPFTAEGVKTTKITVGNGGVALWTDMDVEYSGSMVARYDLEMSQGGKVVVTANCDPFDVKQKIGVVSSTRGTEKVVSYSGKMGCRKGLDDVPAGVTDIKVTLSIPGKPAKMAITKMDLVFKE
jgi:hypothetical protein